ncbi:MAG: acetyltransferase [Acidobacteria bacterium]|nr:acetyltransferase [Acidobacteriota bacterium]
MTTLAELGEAVRLQKEIWGFEDIELLPLRLFVVAQKVGGQTLGAFDGDKMVGFLLSIPGLKQGQMFLHSHMMGVRPEYRNSGLGRTMKLMQRVDALERGIPLVQWTFDPLELKNAYFNIERLGAIVKLYVLNQYGTTTSHLHGGLPTDRCVAEWHLQSERVVSLLEGRPRPDVHVQRRIEVPNDIADIRANEPKRAREIQSVVSEQFVRYTGEGLAVVGFEKSAEKGTYLLGPWDSK